MLEYMFFDERIRDQFVKFLADRGVEAGAGDDEDLIVLVPEDLDDALADDVDEEFERLLQATPEMLGDDAVEKSAAGVMVQLSDGTPCQVRLDPDLMARLMNCLSLEELRDLVQDIAMAVENPDDGPICKSPGK